MTKLLVKRLAVLAVLPIALLGAALVSADGATGDARATIAEVEAKRPAGAASGSDVAARAFASAEAPLAEAKRALEQAQALRAKGDVSRAEIAEATALEWAQAARDEIAAVEGSAEADAVKAQADDAGTKAERARQLLDEAIARRSRLQGSLDELDREAQLRAVDAGAPAKKKGGKP